MMLNVRRGESLKSGGSESQEEIPQSCSERQEVYNRDEEVDEDGVTMEEQDEMLLTKTDAMSVRYGTGNVCSTQRSTSSVPGEFEKRITDIKNKLNQIKSSINNDLVSSS